MTATLQFPTRSMESASAVESAKVLKAALRKDFPAVKFSVTLSRGTGYGYCSVGWTDGPSVKAVKAVTDWFEGSTFDGMTDMEEYTRATLPDGRRSGLRGVSTSRHISPAFARRLIAQIAAFWRVEPIQLIEYKGWNGAPAWKLDGRPVLAKVDDWDTLIYQAAGDATKYAQSAK